MSNRRKVVRLVYSLWSGLVKYLRNQVCFQHKAVEIGPLGIFGPVTMSQARDPLFKGPVQHPSATLPQPVIAVLNENFLNQLGEVSVDVTSA